jgi:protein-L-isoaspartate(D-aspartate) O-methyltransferase
MKPLTEEHFATLRRHIVDVIDIEFDLASEETGRPALGGRLREALLSVPRHLFVPTQFAPFAYRDQPLPIGFDKTISQPFIGALMAELLDLGEDSRVLEVCTGLGHLTAIVAMLAAEVYSIEVVEEFAGMAKRGCASLATPT